MQPQYSATAQLEQALMFRQQDLNGYIFEDKIVFDLPSLSAIHCAHTCLTRPQCVMFTMTSWSGHDAKCRGLSDVMKRGNDVTQHVLGSFVFVLKERAEAWLKFSWHPYGRRAIFCRCHKSRLQAGFVAYPGSKLLATDSSSSSESLHQASSLLACKQLCRADRQCRSFNMANGACTTHYHTASPGDFRTSLGPYVWHYQRMCA
ncbi:hypothetical protein ACOMHN_064340 [Nucella lapillus]